jgi:radical SAM superfamily enzyme YgiQ (UPF0313 family)
MSIETRPDTITKKSIYYLKKAGCKVIRLGIESGSPYIRNDIFKKNISNHQILKSIKICKTAGITTIGYFILGAPGESHNSLQESFNFAKKSCLDVTSFATYKPFQKTDAYDKVIELGGKIYPNNWKKSFNILVGSMIDTPNLSPKQIQKYQKKINSYFIRNYFFKKMMTNPVKFSIGLSMYILKLILNGIKIEWFGFGWVTQLDYV